LRNIDCKDHQHPFVKITLKKPEENNAEAVAFMMLFAQAKSTISRLGTAAKVGELEVNPTLSAQMEPRDCEYVEFDGEVYICCCNHERSTGIYRGCSCGGIV
jgi:hypothetical protein